MNKKLLLIALLPVALLLVIILILNICGFTLVHESKLQTPVPVTATPTPTVFITPTPTVAPTPTPTPTPTLTPSPSPTPSPTPTPAPTPTAKPVSNPPKITKHPTAETVVEGGSCMFIAKYENAIWAEWHFVSPNGTRDLNYAEAQKEFPTLTIINGHTKDLKLEKVPLSLSGWKVYCRFSNNSGVSKTNSALITVTAKPAETPKPTETPTPTATPAPQTIDFEGRWAEETAGRCQITFTTRIPGSYNVDIAWSSSAFERACWKMTGNSNAANTLTYSDGHYWLETYTSDTEYTISDEVFSLTGTFTLQNGKLTWVNNQTGEQTTFVRA